MKKQFYVWFFIVAGMCLLYTACNNILNNIHYKEAEMIDAQIRGMGHLVQEEDRGIYKVEPPLESCSGCTFTHIMGFINNTYLPIFTPSIWPGYLMNPARLASGDYISLAADRAPLTLLLSDTTTTYPLSGIQATEQSVNSAISIFSRTQKMDSHTIPSVYTKIEDVYSPTQLRVIMGAHLKTMPDKADLAPKNQFDFDTPGEKIRILITLLYVYFSASIADPVLPHELFTDSVTWPELGAQLGERISPVYVNNVEYGKMALFFIEAPSNGIGTGKALHSALLNITNEKTNNADKGIINDPSVSMKALVFEASDVSVRTISGYDDFKAQFDSVKQVSGAYLSSCVPVRYTLKYLNETDTKLDIALSGTYCAPICDAAYSLTINSRDDTGGIKGNTFNVSTDDTVQVITASAYLFEGTQYTFARWNIDSGNCAIDDDTLSSTTSTNFTNDCAISAEYTATTPVPTIEPTVTPTSVIINPTPTAVIADTPPPETEPPPPTPDPTPTPTPVYTLTVVWVEGIGNGKSETRTGITPDSVQYITTSSGWSVDTHSPAGIKYTSFAGWEITGDADIDDLNSNSTYVRNFRGDVSVKPTYTTN